MKLERSLTTRETCLADMTNKSLEMTVLHCPPEWDLYSEMCWEPTPAGEIALHQCTDDGFLNSQQYASRLCLSDGTWFINYTFSDQPYTNYTSCFLPLDPTAEDDLKKLVDDKIIFILKSIDEHKHEYLPIYVVSIILLISSTILSATGIFKLRQKNYSTLSYIALTISAAALLINHSVSISMNAVDDATKIIKCRSAKFLVILSTLIFHEFLLAYIYLCIVPVLQVAIKPWLMKTTVAVTVSVSLLLVVTELMFETFTWSTKFCGFKTLQSPYHWLSTTPKLLLMMSHVSIGSVIAFGVVVLRHAHLVKGNEIWYIRQRAVSALVLVLYNVIQEILLVLIHTEAYMDYEDLPVDEYVRAFSIVTAAHGIAFFVIMILPDLGLLTMLRLYLSCFPPKAAAIVEQEFKTYETQASQISINVENTNGSSYQTGLQTVTHSNLPDRSQTEAFSKHHDRPLQVFQQDQQQHLRNSKLLIGFLK